MSWSYIPSCSKKMKTCSTDDFDFVGINFWYKDLYGKSVKAYYKLKDWDWDLKYYGYESDIKLGLHFGNFFCECEIDGTEEDHK